MEFDGIVIHDPPQIFVENLPGTYEDPALGFMQIAQVRFTVLPEKGTYL